MEETVHITVIALFGSQSRLHPMGSNPAMASSCRHLSRLSFGRQSPRFASSLESRVAPGPQSHLIVTSVYNCPTSGPSSPSAVQRRLFPISSVGHDPLRYTLFSISLPIVSSFGYLTSRPSIIAPSSLDVLIYLVKYMLLWFASLIIESGQPLARTVLSIICLICLVPHLLSNQLPIHPWTALHEGRT